jgi:hypothetical protein
VITLPPEAVPGLQQAGPDGGAPQFDHIPATGLKVGMLASYRDEWAVVEHMRETSERVHFQLRTTQTDRVVRTVSLESHMLVRTDVVIDTDDVAAARLAHEDPQHRRYRNIDAGVTVRELDDLLVGDSADRWTEADAHGRAGRFLRAQLPCCDRAVRLPALPDIPRMTVCCRCRRLYTVNLTREDDGFGEIGYTARFTVAADGLLVAAHRGGRS